MLLFLLKIIFKKGGEIMTTLKHKKKKKMGVKDVILLINQRENQADVTTDSKENPKKKHVCRSELLTRIYKRRHTWFFPQSGVREVNSVST